jgi:glycosyltransferase involved in cell wall biosynthesis
VPARYGGFETAIEEIGSRLVGQIDLSVYGKPEQDIGKNYLGIKRIEVPALHFKSLETLSRTFLSVLHVIFINKPNLVILFNCANSPFIFLLKLARIPVILHPDGLEWKRGKWGKFGKWYLKTCEGVGIRNSDFVIADSVVLQVYYDNEYRVKSEFLAYGANAPSIDISRIRELNLIPREYLLLVCRFEPENHPLEIVRAFLKSETHFPLVVVGHAPYETQYQNELHSILESKRVIFLGAIWDQNLLNSLYANSHSYLHGHSVGGTNPSLLRAIANGAQVIAFESPFNREVLESFGIFFSNESDLVRIFSEMQIWNESMENEVEESRLQILKNYNWDDISKQYKKLIGRALGIL